jgi:1-acyl-sn-glycerol-3-phosphate acyltransferase
MTARADGPGRTRPRVPASRRGLSADSPLLGGPFAVEAGAEEPQPREPAYDARSDVLDLPPEPPRAPDAPRAPDLRELRELVPAAEPGREVDDWGRSQRVFDLIEPLLDFYYRYWFRVETEGIEHVPSQGGALIVSNHSGALPPDAPMIMQAIRHEHRHPRPLYMLGEHWFKGYPGVGMLANKIGLVAAHPANAQRLLRDEQRLALAFPEGQKGSRKLYWQRYRLRRFGRGGFVRTAMRAGVPIVPVAVIGAEEAMPIFAHVPLLQRLTGLIYFPINHAFPHFGPAAAAMYLPAKFRIRFLEPVDLSGSGYLPEDAEDVGLVQQLAEEIRGRIQAELDELLLARRSVWFG